VIVVSYPRSGNTWIRFLLANALRPEQQATFVTIGDVVPDIYDEPDAALLAVPPPRILKSHEPFDARYRRVVYLVRHPADVAQSYYHYLTKMRVLDPGYDRARFVAQFIAGSFDDFGPWGDHVLGWLDGRAGSAEFLFLRYEDLLEQPELALSRVLSLLGAIVPETLIKAAVARSTAAELRRVERETAMALPSFRRSKPDLPFIRSARAGAGAEELGPELTAQILEAWPGAVDRAGYGTPGGSR
jgi:hypothetical protein